jgi:hypothetical protein
MSNRVFSSFLRSSSRGQDENPEPKGEASADLAQDRNRTRKLGLDIAGEPVQEPSLLIFGDALQSRRTQYPEAKGHK